MQQPITISNKHGQKLVGVLHDTGSPQLVVLCHGFRSTKEYIIMVGIAGALEKEGISAFRFDFSGNGESEGSFQCGNYFGEVGDLRSVVEYFVGLNRSTIASSVIAKEKLNTESLKKSMNERLNINMQEACLSVDASCRFLTVHGSADEVNPVEDAKEFAKILRNHQLKIIEGANHGYSSHQDELVSAVLPFVKEMCATR